MSEPSFEIRRVTPHCGAEVIGLDLSQPLSDEQVKELETALAEHPLIRTHPISGRQAIFVNRIFTTRILGVSKSESDHLLKFLFEHIERLEFQCRFQWRENSVAFWDNRHAQHLALWDYYPHRRRGHRVTIKGDAPFYRA